MDIVLGIFYVMPKALLFEHFRRCYEINFSCVWTNNNLLHNFIYIQAHDFFFRCVSHDISKGILSKILNIKWFITDHHFLLFFACLTSCRVALKPIGPIASNWAPHVGVIYSWLFKYTQQHTASFTENTIGHWTS
jgi:hypothetical protein